MKMRKFFILLPTVFALGVMLVSCTSYKQPAVTSPLFIIGTPPIATTMIEVTGEEEKEKIEKLRIEFNREDGTCKKLWVNDEPRSCDEFGSKLQETYFCTPPDDDHPANTDIKNNGKIDKVYCGKVRFLTEGTDIQFKAGSAADNKKCKKIGGKVYCF